MAHRGRADAHLALVQRLRRAPAGMTRVQAEAQSAIAAARAAVHEAEVAEIEGLHEEMQKRLAHPPSLKRAPGAPPPFRLRGTTLEVTRAIGEPHCPRWSCILSRAINGTAVGWRGPLAVNGEAVVPLPKPSRQ